MIHRSIKSCLILLTLTLYITTAVIVILVVNHQMMKTTETYERTLMSDRVRVILNNMELQYQRLQQTQTPEAYEEDFKATMLNSIREQYYVTPLPDSYPVVVDLNGVVILHPFLATGTPAPLDNATRRMYSEQQSGEIYYESQGIKKWNYFERFKPWNWVVFYTTPLAVKYAHARQMRNTLMTILFPLTAAMCVLMAVALSRVTRPIEQLTQASKDMAEGKLNRPIAITGTRELAVLAKNFDMMRNAIREKLDVIESQNMSLSKLVSDVESEAQERRRAEDNQRSSQRLLASTFEQSPMSMWISDEHGRMLRANDACRKLFHVQDGDVQGKYCLYDDKNLRDQNLIPLVDSVYRKGESVRLVVESDLSLLTAARQGTLPPNMLTLDVTIAPIKDEYGKVTNAVIQALDITEQKRAEWALREAEQFSRSVVNQAGEAIVVFDRTLRFLEWNRFAEELTGVKAQELLGRTYFDVFPQLKAYGLEDMIQRALNGETVVTPDLHVQFTASEKDVWLIGTYSPYRNTDGEIIGVVASIRDITERQASEEQLRQYRDHLEEQVAQRTKELQEVHQEMVRVARQAGMAEIASGVLHNVGNVLNSVRVTTSLLRDHNDKSRTTRLSDVAEMLHANRDHLGEFLSHDAKGQHIPVYLERLATHLKDENSEINELVCTLIRHVDHISEIIAIQQQYSKAVGLTELVDIPSLIRDALSFTATSRQRHHVEVSVDCQDMPPVLIDRHRVLQILLNLVNNAKQALKDSHADPRAIRITASRTATTLRITVTDNGIGFTPEIHARLFTHGFTTKKDGHGFGLHSGILSAKEMGGSLSAASEGPERGATFVLELPYRTAEVHNATA